MEYTVQKLSQIAGVSTRTLRYYDEIGILKPARTSSSGYRIYGQKEVDLLQQIMFYREMGVNLDTIKAIMTSKDFDEMKALQSHLVKLLAQRQELDQLIENVTKTMEYKKGITKMNNKEKFNGFKKKLVEENPDLSMKTLMHKLGLLNTQYTAFTNFLNRSANKENNRPYYTKDLIIPILDRFGFQDKKEFYVFNASNISTNSRINK
jgi:DNA-binding transcriptional MerR regulator